MNDETTLTRRAFITAAREMTCDADIDVDTDAVVSYSDTGAYVQCWVWVSNKRALDTQHDSE